MHSIGIMQGRLVPPVGARIQAFPASRWRDEFAAARRSGLSAIEWIFDADDDGNPIASAAGLAELRALSALHGVEVRSLCADHLMAEPLLKGTPDQRVQRTERLAWLLAQCETAGIGRVVLPFVDGSRLEGDQEIGALVAVLRRLIQTGRNRGVELHLETALPPERFARLLCEVGDPVVKVAYDSGNSASLGFDADEEFAAYGARIGSLHVKDRVFGGSTVPLGSGDVDFDKLMLNLKRVNYTGDFILQVARDRDGDEIAWARRNREFLQNLLAQYL